ncbi:MAG: hypothetical protein AB7D39_17655 [Pseudodesulfovibrio sp.]|uniref:hypothetical protein n=1 Tax=Pseudodesulfovibrio sp. TaxID=2035812 RepID=UPI003D0A0B29
MTYVIIGIVALAAGIAGAFFLFTRKDDIVETVTDAVDDLSGAVSHAATELNEEINKIGK